MDFTLDQQADGQAQLTLHLEESDIKPAFQEKLKEYGKKMRLNGFRQGKVPPGLVKKLHGQSIFFEELNKLIDQSVQNYIQENELDVIGQPQPKTQLDPEAIDLDNPGTISIDFSLGLVPEFSYDLENLQLTHYKLQPDEEELQRRKESVRQQLGKAEEVETSQKGDIIEGKLTSQTNPDAEAKDAYITFEQIQEDQQDKFVGLKVGDALNFNMAEAFTDEERQRVAPIESEEEQAQFEGAVRLEVTKIMRSQPAELNQELFDQVFGEGEVQSEEEFDEKIRDIMRQENESWAQEKIRLQIRDKLVDQTEITLPEDFLKEQYRQNSQEEVDEKELEENWPTYVRDLRWSVLAQRIAENEEIKVEPEEVQEKARNQVRQQFISYGMGAMMTDEMVDNMVQNQLGNQDNVRQIYDQVLFSKVFDRVQEKAQINEQSIASSEEAEKTPSEEAAEKQEAAKSASESE